MNKKIATEVALGIIIIIAIVVGGAIWMKGYILEKYLVGPGTPPRACTEEAKLCDDGVTYVGRTGSNCEFAACPAIVGIENKIIITSPKTNDTVGSPVAVSGRAVGTWFFEGSFPVEIYDGNVKLLGSGPASFIPSSPDDTWMTEDFVDFKASINFSQPATETGYILFRKDNPSGNAAMDESFKLPVKFGSDNVCVKEGESIGAVAPGVVPKKCCAGLAPVVPKNIVGTLGICQKADGDVSWKTYTNPQYGFTLTFSDTWKGYSVSYRQLDWGGFGKSDSWDFGFPSQKDLFNVSVHTKTQYDNIVKMGEPIGKSIGENDKYVFVGGQSQYTANDEMAVRYGEISDILKTFKLTK